MQTVKHQAKYDLFNVETRFITSLKKNIKIQFVQLV